jgi:hypothetical protein
MEAKPVLNPMQAMQAELAKKAEARAQRAAAAGAPHVTTTTASLDTSIIDSSSPAADADTSFNTSVNAAGQTLVHAIVSRPRISDQLRRRPSWKTVQNKDSKMAIERVPATSDGNSRSPMQAMQVELREKAQARAARMTATRSDCEHDCKEKPALNPMQATQAGLDRKTEASTTRAERARRLLALTPMQKLQDELAAKAEAEAARAERLLQAARSTETAATMTPATAAALRVKAHRRAEQARKKVQELKQRRKEEAERRREEEAKLARRVEFEKKKQQRQDKLKALMQAKMHRDPAQKNDQKECGVNANVSNSSQLLSVSDSLDFESVRKELKVSNNAASPSELAIVSDFIQSEWYNEIFDEELDIVHDAQTKAGTWGTSLFSSLVSRKP